MSLSIVTNVSSLQAQQNLTRTSSSLSSSFAKLSSGMRINSAADDAAGLAISERMKTQIRSYVVAERNANDAISMTQTAEATLGEMHDILGRMRELAEQSANGSLGTAERGYLNNEYQSLGTEITRIQNATKFNGVSLVGTGATAAVAFQVGLNNTAAADQISVTFDNLDLSAFLGTGIATQATAQGVLASGGAATTVDGAIATVSASRAGFGAAMNRLDMATANIQTMRLNLSAANSRIVDVDVADESANLSKNQVLTQAGVSVLAQANGLPQLAFGLIGH